MHIKILLPLLAPRDKKKKKEMHHFKGFPNRLGPANSRSFAIRVKPFSSLALKLLTWVIATTTKICTKGNSTVAHATLASQSPSRFLLLIKNYNQISLIEEYRSTSSRDFSAIHFRDRFIRQVSCYTLLSGFRLPWPPSCCLDESTPFLASMTLALRHLNSSFGSSHIASSAYQIWPTCDLLYSPCVQCIIKDHNTRKSTTSKFENKSRILNPRTAELSPTTSNHSLYLIQLS